MNTAALSDWQAQDNLIALANTLGHSVLVQTIKMAAYYLNHSNNTSFQTFNREFSIREAKSCYYFIQGTGLDVIIDRFGMDYDSDKIKKIFNYCVRRSM